MQGDLRGLAETYHVRSSNLISYISPPPNVIKCIIGDISLHGGDGGIQKKQKCLGLLSYWFSKIIFHWDPDISPTYKYVGSRIFQLLSQECRQGGTHRRGCPKRVGVFKAPFRVGRLNIGTYKTEINRFVIPIAITIASLTSHPHHLQLVYWSPLMPLNYYPTFFGTPCKYFVEANGI